MNIDKIDRDLKKIISYMMAAHEHDRIFPEMLTDVILLYCVNNDIISQDVANLDSFYEDTHEDLQDIFFDEFIRKTIKQIEGEKS